MRLKTKWIVLFLVMLFTCKTYAQPLFWHNFNYSKYQWIDSNLNVIQTHNKSNLRPLFLKLNNSNKKKVHILHIGDSHVQADIFTNETRTLMGSSFGYAGRGLVFPYTTARTHTAADYRCYHSGKWLYARNVERNPELPLGVSGITSRTLDSNAQFRLVFKEDAIKNDFTVVKILCKRSPYSYDLKISAGNESKIVDVFSDPKDSLTDEVIIELDSGYSEYKFTLVSNDSLQNNFEIYGLSFESAADRGVLYTSVGINGAGHYSILRENLLPQQLKILNPDAIILDVGANDFYQRGMDVPTFKDNLISIIDLFKKQLPRTVIILSNSQDIHRGGYSIKSCSIFSMLISEVAKEKNVAFYDWYRVAGGDKSMRIWRSLRLANRDGVHLTRDGYNLKGDLIYQSFKSTWKQLITKPDTNSSLIIPCVDTLLLDSNGNLKDGISNSSKKWIEHEVEAGETAWGIAQQYGVSITDLKEWNKLRSYSLRKGQKLKVYTLYSSNKTITPVKTATSKNTTNRSTQRSGSGYRIHRIKSGETLYSIARKYGTSVSKIKRANNMRSDFIRAGKRIKIPY